MTLEEAHAMDNRRYSPVYNNTATADRAAQGGNKQSLAARIQQLDFAIQDAVLYLDVYPACREALTYIAGLNDQRAEAVASYESMYGPMNMYGIRSEQNSDPWPWQYSMR